MDGIINVLKPAGMTSFDVVAVLRRLTGVRKIGHTGTLDPDATGVLPVCIGKATRAVEHLTEKTKSYRAEMVLGVETDTQDASGEVLRTAVPDATDDQIREACAEFVGERLQLPPMHSAIKINGRKLYEAARAGESVERTPRAVVIHSIRLAGIRRSGTEVRVLIDVVCSKGTYVRTICHDIGEKLGCGAHMSFLLRTSSGPFRLETAHTLEAVAEASVTKNWSGLLLPIETAFAELSRVDIPRALVFRLGSGMPVEAGLSEVNGLPEATGLPEEAGLPEATEPSEESGLPMGTGSTLMRVFCEETFLGLAAREAEGGIRIRRWMADDPQNWRLS